MPNDKSKPMDQGAKSRVMSAGSANNGGETQKGSWEARAQVCDVNIKHIFTHLFYL